MNIDLLYNTALDIFSVDGQIEKAVEECAELIVALKHIKNTSESVQEVVTEIADVTIMCEQLARIYGREKVNKEICKKRERLAVRLLSQRLIIQEQFDEIIK